MTTDASSFDLNIQNFARKTGVVLGKVQTGEELCRQEAKETLLEILQSDLAISNVLWSSLFSAIQVRGATIDEVMGFVDAVSAYDTAFTPLNDEKLNLQSEPIYSITGSGKDTWKTFNISTAASFIAAAQGLTIFKPGSQALSSVTGASDVLMQLDVPKLISVTQAAELLECHGFAVLDYSVCLPKYASRYGGIFYAFHPLSYVLPPLAIPFRLKGIVYGIANARTSFSLDLLRKYGFTNVSAVTTMLDKTLITDEYVPFGKSIVSSFFDGKYFSQEENFANIENAKEIAQLDSHVANAEFFLKVLRAETLSPAVKAAAGSAASILFTAGKVNSLKEGYASSLKAVLNRSALDALDRYRIAAQRLTRPIFAGMFDVLSPELIAKAERAADAISDIPRKWGYQTVGPHSSLRSVSSQFLNASFGYSDNLLRFDEVAVQDQVIVSGFGPTNAPTAGTLSVILKIVALQKQIGCEAEIIISDLGAFLSRRLPWSQLSTMADKFQLFINVVTASSPSVFVRTHIDRGNLGLSPFVNEHLLKVSDFFANKEATELLYSELGLLGTQFGVIADSTYTVCDIIKPLFSESITQSAICDKKRVLVIAGIEEHYFPRLANSALKQLKRLEYGAYVDKGSTVSGLYTRVIPGFPPYPKMSKSIPASGLTLENSSEEIFRKIVHADSNHDLCIREMMIQASGWSDDNIAEAEDAFQERLQRPLDWTQQRMKYAERFINFSNIWKGIYSGGRDQ